MVRLAYESRTFVCSVDQDVVPLAIFGIGFFLVFLFFNFLVFILSFHCNKNNKKIIDIADTNSLKCTWSKWRPTTYFILHVVDSCLTSSEQYILMTRASLHTIHHVGKRRHLWVWKLSFAKEHHRSVITSGIINSSSYCG